MVPKKHYFTAKILVSSIIEDMSKFVSEINEVSVKYCLSLNKITLISPQIGGLQLLFNKKQVGIQRS